MKILTIIMIFLVLGFSSFSFAYNTELAPCIEIAHCVKEEWEVESIDKPFRAIKGIIENTPRTKIVELEKDYIRAEVTTKWMRFVDDLEITYLPKSNKLQIRSESRVGESDLGVNRKRFNALKAKIFQRDIIS